MVRRPSLRRALTRCALACAGAAVALLAVEVVFRLAAPAARYQPSRHLENAEKTVGLDVYPSNPRGSFDVDLRDVTVRSRYAGAGVPGLEEAARHTPYAVAFSYNAERCRDREVGARTSGTRRVVILGDSFAEGQGVREPDTFARRIERALRGMGRDVEVVNCGRRGRDFPELFDAFERLLSYQPDVVLYAMVLNDPVQSPEFKARQDFLNDWILDRRRMLSEGKPEWPSVWKSHALGFILDEIEARRVERATTKWYDEMYGPPNGEGWSETQRYLQRMNESMRSRGGRLVVALLPLLVDTDGHYPFDGPTAEVRIACERTGIPFYDALAALRGRPAAALWVNPVDLHPNEVAHALLAEALTPVVARALDESGNQS
jgi:hypothetical protein